MNENLIQLETPECPYCGKTHIVMVYPSHLEKYNKKELVQNAFPELSPDEKEMLITGICDDCWTKYVICGSEE